MLIRSIFREFPSHLFSFLKNRKMALKSCFWGINKKEWEAKYMNEQQLQHLKNELLDELKRIEERPDNDRVFESTELSNYDNHPADQATDLTDQATELAMDKFHDFQKEEIKEALRAMEAGTYGTCVVCGKEIPYERLEAMPRTLTCIEHAEDTLDTTERSVEEGVLTGNTSHPSNLKDYRVDGEDSFLVVEEYGSSDSPSDKGSESDGIYDTDL